MTNTTAKKPTQPQMPEFIVMALQDSGEQEKEAVMVLNDEPQTLIEAFTCKDIEETIQIQTALENRHEDANFIVISSQIMLNMFAALSLSEDGQIFHDDVFKVKHMEPVAFENINFRTIKDNPVLRLISEGVALRIKLESIKNIASTCDKNAAASGYLLPPNQVASILAKILLEFENPFPTSH